MRLNRYAPGSTALASAARALERVLVRGNTIKSLGAHEVTVRLHDEVSATVALNVIPA